MFKMTPITTNKYKVQNMKMKNHNKWNQIKSKRDRNQ